MSHRRSQSSTSAIITAARTQVAEQGLRGLSLRKVAARAGSSRGGVTHQAGHKAGLVANLISDALAFQLGKHKRWLELTSSLDLSSKDVLAAVVRSFLNEAVTQERAQSLVLCELVAECARKKEHHADLATLVLAEERFWSDLLRGAHNAAILGWAIACYCRDELPFALALQGHAEYHLLRSATIARLVHQFAPAVERGFATGFDRFITNAAMMAEEDAAHPVKGTQRALEIGRAIAGLIQHEGVAGVTHRSVAAAAGIPNSTVAHYFRTREDLLKAGLSAIYRQLTAAEPLLPLKVHALPDMTLSTASHAIAIEATRDGSLVPAALYLRTMRGQFIWQELIEILGPGRTDLAALQGTGMIIIGSGLGLHLAGGDILAPMRRIQCLISNNRT